MIADEGYINCNEDYIVPVSLEKFERKEAAINNTLLTEASFENISFPLIYKSENEHQFYQKIQYGSNKWIELANQTAYESVRSGGGPFGAVIVQVDISSNRVIRYWRSNNMVTLNCDPTAHAEVSVIRKACSDLGVYYLGEIHKSESKLSQIGEISICEIYSSCEPCPMCYSAISWARIKGLYFAATRFDAEAPGVNFSDAEFYSEMELPYEKRKIKVHQCDSPNSLDAFNLWKNIEKEDY